LNELLGALIDDLAISYDVHFKFFGEPNANVLCNVVKVSSHELSKIVLRRAPRFELYVHDALRFCNERSATL